MSDISGQSEALFAVERALVHGTSGILFCGPAGSPKDEIIERLPSIMEPLPDGRECTIRRVAAKVDEVSIVHEAKLASAGVLYLTEVNATPSGALQALRSVCASMSAPPLLVASSYMCPCGHMDFPLSRCECSKDEIVDYGLRIGGIVLPLGIYVIAPVHSQPSEAVEAIQGAPSAVIRARIARARIAMQHETGN